MKRKKIIEHVDSSDSGSDVSFDDTHELNDQEEDLQSFEDDPETLPIRCLIRVIDEQILSPKYFEKHSAQFSPRHEAQQGNHVDN